MPARTSKVVNRASTGGSLVRPAAPGPAQGGRGEHSHPPGNVVKATLRNFKFLKVAFTNHEPPNSGDGDGQLVHAGAFRGDGGFAVAGAVQGADRPLARRRVEAEVAVGRRDDLAGEVAAAVQEPDERAADRPVRARHLAREHDLPARVVVRRCGLLDRCAAAVVNRHHLAPNSTGTPTSEPYSVHEPS